MPTCPACGQENPENARFCLACGKPLAPPELPREQRKTVTVVFADVVSSTELGERHDPEAVRRVMARYFEEARPVLERHGGSVEKFIGDAVMAVFGIPVVHEDDALRAVRAAVELRDSLAAMTEELLSEWGVSLAIRTGVNTGEVVAGGGESLVTGDAVNVAARLEQAAAPGEVLIGDRTYRLVAGAVEAEPAGPLELKGKAEGVPAHRVLRVIEGAEPYARRLDAPMVGRTNELAQLRTAYERAVRERAAHLFTVLGAAGIGKSRLVQEFLAGVDGVATVLTGRCLPYGEGITYWPLVAMFRHAAQDDAHARLAAMLAGEPDADLIAGRVAAAIGEGGGASSSDETAWAVRKLFEHVAGERPLVAVFDDLQWGEPTLLDLVEHVVDLSREAPILLLCVARPDLLDERPTWGGGKLNATSILLEPLSDGETSALMDELLAGAGVSDETKARIADAAEGNPLFVEQMLAMVSENGGGDIRVPPTIQALLAARLDRLPSPERAVIDRASVVGKEFWRGAVAEMAPTDVRPAVAGHLTALVRKELIRPGRSFLPGEDAFRFRHLLIRDAAYDAMPKELRAELHERFAAWLDAQSDGRLVEVDEITGYHLEQAYRYRAELGPIDADARGLAARAGRRLVAAGRRAFARADMPAAATLLRRAAALLEPADPERLEMLPELVEATGEMGDLSAAREYVDEALGLSENLADERLRAYVTLANLEWRIFAESAAAAELFPEVERLISVLEAAGDDRGLARAWRLVSQLRLIQCRAEAMSHALERAVEYARRAGDRRIEHDSLGWLAASLWWSPLHVSEALPRVAEIVQEAGPGAARGFGLQAQAALEATLGNFERAFELSERAKAELRELGLVLMAAGAAYGRAMVAMHAGDPARAERELRASISNLQEAGERGVLSTNAAVLAHALCAQGRAAEAEQYVRMSEENAGPDDAASQITWRTALAKIRANQGEHGEAVELVRAALAFAEKIDFPAERAAVFATHAEVLIAAGRPAEAEAPLREALALYEQKGDVVSAGRVRAQLAELTAA
jgi:class 3 adenylate cyclase/tetratricopeptide (TPR) repeat protein